MQANGDLIAARRVEAVDGEKLLTDGVAALSAVECPVHAARYSAVYKSSYPSLYNPSLNRRESASGRARLPGNPFAAHRNLPTKPAHSRYMAPLPVTNSRRRVQTMQPDNPQGCPYCDAEAHEGDRKCEAVDMHAVHVPWLWGAHLDWNRTEDQWLLDYKTWKVAETALSASGVSDGQPRVTHPDHPDLDESSSDGDDGRPTEDRRLSPLYGVHPPSGVEWDYRKFGTADSSLLPVGILPPSRRPRGRTSRQPRHTHAKLAPRPRGVHLFGDGALARSDGVSVRFVPSPPRAVRASVSANTAGKAEQRLEACAADVLAPVT
jgi:hypothetical protein